MCNNLEKWSIEKLNEFYGVDTWSSGYFHITPKGELAISPFGDPTAGSVSIPEIIVGLKDRGLDLPVLLRC